MKKAMTVLAVLSCALAAVAADAKDPKKDPRRTYSSDGWKLSRSDWPDGQNPFRKPMFIIMNLALGGYGNKVVDEDTKDEKSGKVIPAAKFPMEMKVDWVRYYTRN